MEFLSYYEYGILSIFIEQIFYIFDTCWYIFAEKYEKEKEKKTSLKKKKKER